MTQLVYGKSYGHVIRIKKTKDEYLGTYTSLYNFYVFKDTCSITATDIQLAVETLATTERNIRFHFPTNNRQTLQKLGDNLSALTRGNCTIPFALDIDHGQGEIALMRM